MLEIYENNKKENIPLKLLSQLPKFLIIGAAKCGTTSLCDNLDQHPDLSLSSIKEPRFFYSQKRYFSGPAKYIKLWENAKEGALRFEGSTIYSFVECQARIQAMIPDIKLIMMVRNPTDRLWSHYWPQYSQPPFSHPLESTMNPMSPVVRRGIYVEQIELWHKFFPKENLLIIRSEDYFHNEKMILKTIHSFLGVQNITPQKISKQDPWADKKKITGYPPIPEKVKQWANEFYHPYNLALEKYLGRDFGWNKNE